MKKIAVRLLLLISFLVSFNGQEVKAKNKSTAKHEEVNTAKAESLLCRIEEIRQMDRSQLTAFQKKELRKEVQSIKKQLRDIKWWRLHFCRSLNRDSRFAPFFALKPCLLLLQS